jgi:hypothetical protein
MYSTGSAGDGFIIIIWIIVIWVLWMISGIAMARTADPTYPPGTAVAPDKVKKDSDDAATKRRNGIIMVCCGFLCCTGTIGLIYVLSKQQP